MTESEWNELWEDMATEHTKNQLTPIGKMTLDKIKAVGDRREQKLEALQDSKDKLAVEWSSVYDKLEAIKEINEELSEWRMQDYWNKTDAHSVLLQINDKMDELLGVGE